MSSAIRLSYNVIDFESLRQVLQRYDGIPHPQIVRDFETELGKITGAKHVVALQSGTSAIHLALMVLGVSKGDVIIAPSFTYVATINPICYLGAEPVFIDAEPETWNMDPILLETAVKDYVANGRKPKAIVVVHTYGMPAAMDRILNIATRYDIPLIEDAAESLGSTYNGTMTGTLGKLGIYSFNNNKAITTFGGGALISEDEELIHQARFLAAQAREQKPFYEHHAVGYNYLMSPLNATYGLMGLEKFTSIIEKRRSTYSFYGKHLKNVDLLIEADGSSSSRWLSTVLFEDWTVKTRVVQGLTEQGIETRPLWKPMHQQPVFANFECYGGRVSEVLFERGLCLPSGNDITDAELQQVVDIVNGITVGTYNPWRARAGEGRY